MWIDFSHEKIVQCELMSERLDHQLTAERIQEIKSRLRGDLEVRRLCQTLGVTVEEFLSDIEKQGESVQLFDDTSPAERARTDAEILEAAELGFARARQEADVQAGRIDADADPRETERQSGALRTVGRARDQEAPRELGQGRVLVGEPSLDADTVTQQVLAGRMRGGRV